MAFSRWFSAVNKINLRRQAIVKKINSNPYYRFQSPEEILIASELGIKIDANIASVDDWLRLPGISIRQARNLVEISNSGLNFLCLEDLAGALGVSVLKIQCWQPILYFAYYSKESFIAPAKTNVNQGNLKQLLTIPNVDESLAKRILIDRESNGNFRHIADLQIRLNLDEDTSYHLMNYLQF